MTEDEKIAGAETQSTPPAHTAETRTPAPAGPQTTVGGAQSAGGGSLPQPPPADVSASDLQAKLEAAEARLAEMEAAKGEARTLREQMAEQAEKVSRLSESLARSRRASLIASLSTVPEDLRAMVADALGDVDVSTDAGAARVQAFIAERPSLVRRAAPGDDVALMTNAELEALRQNPLVDLKWYRAEMAKLGGVR